MQKIITNKGVIGIFVLILSVLILFLYTKIDSFSIASTSGEVITEINLNKYINYDEEWGKGTLLQYSIKTGVNYNEDIQSPVKNATVTIASPQINEMYPERIVVINKSTKSIGNYSYDKNTGIITIFVSNEDEEGNPISSEINNELKDEFEIISNYGQAAYNDEEAERDLTIQISAKYNLFAQENNVVEEYKEFKAVASKNIGNVLSVSQKVDDVYNGYLKSNIINGTDYSTIYKEYDEIEIGNKNAQENIEINESTEDTIYRSTTVRAEDVINVLGEDGSIEIFDIDGNLVGTLNKDNVTLIYENSLSEINIKTSSVINEGIIRIENTKEVKDKTKLIDNIKTIRQIAGEIYEDIVEIKNSETKVDLTISNSEWTNEKQNEVVFDAVLNNSDIQYNLFKNPTVIISLPNEVDKVIFGESNVLYGNGLELQNVSLEENENGKFIIAKLSGTQTEYAENELGLTTIIRIPASIILKQEIETREEKINVIYANSFTIDGNVEIGNSNQQIKIKNYRENEVANAILEEEQNKLFSQVVKADSVTSVNNSLKLEVAPTKGETVLQNEDIVYEGEYIKYNIKITNTSDEKIEEVKIKTSIPEECTYGELYTENFTNVGAYKYNFYNDITEKEINIGTIEAGESITKFYEVRVNDINDSEKSLITNVTAYIGDEKGPEGQSTLKAQPAEIKSFMGAFYYSQKWVYWLNTYSDEDKEVIIKLKAPKELELGAISYGDTTAEEPWNDVPMMNIIYTNNQADENINISDDNTITLKIMTNRFYEFNFEIDESKIQKSNEQTEVELIGYTEITDNNKTYTSNENRFITGFQNFKVTIISENEGEDLNYNDNLEYNLTIENIGGLKTGTEIEEENYIVANVKDYLPEQLKAQTITYNNWEITEDGTLKETKDITKNISGSTYDENNNKLADVDIDLIIPNNEKVEIKINTLVDMVFEKTKIQNNARVYVQNVSTKTSNTIVNTILPYNVEKEIGIDNNNDNNNDDSELIITPEDNETGNTNNNNDNEQYENTSSENLNTDNNSNITYEISGLAWFDENRDGQRQEKEKMLEGITVSLVDMNNSSNIISNSETGKNGIYSFSDLKTGKYIVIFRYDTNKYSPTEYKVSSASDYLDSDASLQMITLNGQKSEVGVTELIELNSPISNIDIGLVENEKCDFKVDKYINKVKVVTKKGRTDKNYNNVQLAKTEIKAKEIEGSVVTVEYKIVVTNIGETAGKVGQIIDKIPEGFKFYSKVNSEWIQKSDSEVVYTGLSDNIINSGESIDLKLILSKTMTSDLTGTYTNNAEITDITSINKSSDNNVDNNKSSADIIISIGTGSVLYISFAIILLVALTIILIKYKKGFKHGKYFNKIMVLLIALFTSTVVINTTSDSVWFWYQGRDGSDRGWFTGEVGDGWCIDHGAWAEGQTIALTKGVKAYGYWRFKVLSVVTTTKNENKFDYTLTNENPNSLINYKILDNGDFLYGPFNFNASVNLNKFSVELTNSLNETFRGKVCNSSGNIISSFNKGSRSFYVRISSSSTNKGIIGIKFKTSATGESTYEKEIKGIAQYNPPTPGKQRVQTKKRIYIGTQKGSTTTTKSHEIEWTSNYISGGLIISKIDADDSAIKLNNVKIKLDDNEYTIKQNGEIRFDNLKPGSVYTVKEISNDNYGYKINNAISFGNVSIKPGIIKRVILTNEKKTGNLTIKKIDSDTKQPLSNIEFKIKDSTGKYIIARDTKKELQETVKGKIYFGNYDYTYTDDVDKATRFITDKKGKINIYNLLVGEYTIEETYIGNNNYGYDLDNNYISWAYSNGVSTKTTDGTYAKVNVHKQKSYNTVPKTSIKKDKSKIIEDGTYQIVSALGSNWVFEIQSQKPENGANVQLHSNKNSLAQKFYIRYIGEGYYRIINLGNSKRIDLADGKAAKGTNIQTWSKNTSNAQIWKIEKKGKYYRLKSKVGAVYMDVKGGKKENGANIQAWTSNNSAAQKFSFEELTSYDSKYKDTVKVTNKRKYVKLSGNVWEEEKTGKDALINHVLDSKDIKVQGIKVTLKDKNGNTVVKDKDDSNLINPTYTNEKGHYLFEDVIINETKNYYIEFEYDGEIYTTTKSYDELINAESEEYVSISGNVDLIDFNSDMDSNNESEDNEPDDDQEEVAVTSVTLNNSSFGMYTNENKTLVADTKPDNATNPNIIWSSSNTEIATVTDGIVEAKKEGIVTITATSEENNNIKASCVITITKKVWNLNNVEVKLLYSNNESLVSYTRNITPPDTDLDLISDEDIENYSNNEENNGDNNEINIGDEVEYPFLENQITLTNPVYTDSDGNYMFENVPIKGITNPSETYKIVFYYDGVRYETTTPLIGISSIDVDDIDSENENNNETETISIEEVVVQGNIFDTIEAQSENDSLIEENDDEITIEDEYIENEVTTNISLKDIKVTIQDANGNNITAPTYTNEQGDYNFNHINFNEIESYYMTFEYKEDGVQYLAKMLVSETGCKYIDEEAIEGPTPTVKNTSKAQESKGDRAKVDNNYKKIASNGTINMKTDPISSKSKVNGNSGQFDINYSSNVSENSNAYSKSNNMKKFEPLLNNVRNVNKFNGYDNYEKNRIVARTSQTKYGVLGTTTVEKIRKKAIIEVGNINCGLVQREQPNISIYTDLVKVTATVNGYTHDYYYDTLKHAIDQSNGEEPKETFRLDVYNGSKKYIRRVYASDVKSGCEIYLTYRITVKNHSNTLNTKVYKISNYYDARYERIGIGTTEEANNKDSKIIVTDDEEYSESTGYKKSYITYADTPLIQAKGEKSEIYIKYKLNNNAVISIMSGERTFYNIVEAEEYSTYYGVNTYYHNRDLIEHDLYSGIDRNSAPGNAIIENKEGKPSTLTFEDDTMMAPSITITLTTNERKISGNVFEDVQTEESKNNKERLGDGKYTVEDRKVGKVKVELYKYVHPDPDNLKGQEAIWNPSLEEDVAKVWIKQEDGTYEEENAIVWTNENGEYSISGILPGEYVLKYTYGDGTVIYGKSDGTDANTTLTSANKYKSTIITSQNIKNALERNPENAMWYKTTKEGNEIKPAEKNEARYSVAVDGRESYNIDGDGNEVAIKNSNQNILGNDLQEKSAFTAPMNFKFEMVDNDNDGKADIADPTIKRTVTKYNEDGSAQVETVLDYKVNNIDFGIVEKPLKKYDIEKIIKNVKLSIANGPNGQVIIEGNPADTANPLNYVKYLENSPFNRANTVNMEIDNELLVGATLEITYEVKAINKSEVDYHTYGYYYYGTDKTNPITIKFSKVIDYLDNDLLLDSYSINDHIKIAKVGNNEIEIKDGANLTTTNYLENDIIENAKKYQNVLILESDIKTSPINSIEAQKEVGWEYKVSKLLTAVNEKLDFSNYVEAIEIETIGVGSYDNTLGNFDPVPDLISKVDTEYPGETDYYGENISITNPTGGNRNIWIGVTAIFALVILASGIVIIKKKVL